MERDWKNVDLDIVLQLSEDEKKQLAESGTDLHRDILVLIHDDDWRVRYVVACFGTNKHRDQLINDKIWRVRETVAQFGNDSHRSQLVKDKEWFVRCTVAHFGADSHRDTLVHDMEDIVRYVVACHGNDKHRDLLVNDKDWGVRANVARYGNVEHLSALINDEKDYVRNTVYRTMAEKGLEVSDLKLSVDDAKKIREMMEKHQVSNDARKQRKCGFKPSLNNKQKKSNLKM